MKAGREMDALVAEKVMGWTANPTIKDYLFYEGRPNEPALIPVATSGREYYNSAWPGYLWSPSLRIADAWEVVEKMVGDFWFLLEHDVVNQYHAAFEPHDRGGPTLPVWVGGWAETAPTAICLAALKAVGVEVPE